jgi:hypothetical protein
MSKAKGKAQAEIPPPEPVHVEPVAPPSGSGEFSLPDGSRYVGDWKELAGVKVRDGQGTMTSGPEVYKGSWVEDKMDGVGEYSFASGAIYKGDFKKNVFHGKGEYTFQDGAIYTGHWQDNKMHGEGTYTDKDKIEFKGTFFNGFFDSGKSYVSVRNH